MNQNRKRPSRFDPGPSSKGSRGFSGDDIFSSRDLGPTGMQRMSNKTPEQLAFDTEFAKWEKSFEDWKRQFANHPDLGSYREYERKFLDVRDKLLQKRAQIYNQRPNPMDALLNAADSILNRFDGPSQSAPQPLMSMSLPSMSSGWGSSRDSRGDSRGSGMRDNFRSDSRDRRDDRRGDRRDDRRPAERRDQRGNDRRDRDNNRRRDDRDRGRGGPDARNDRRSDKFGANRGRGGDRSGGGRGPPKSMTKPSQREIERELAKKNVYPMNKWINCSTEERPPLVGKRAKKKNAKILKVLERKRRIAAGELDPVEEAAQKAKNKAEREKNEIPLKQRIEILFEEARKAECPKMLPGSGKRRLKGIKSKPESQWTEDDRSFVALASFIQEKRHQYLAKQKAAEGGDLSKAEPYDPSQVTEDPMEVAT